MVIQMKIRLGYVAVPTTINITSSSTITVTNFKKLGNRGKKKIDSIINNNLDNLLQILKYNNSNDIHFYRLTSRLIPLVTYTDFDYLKKYKNKYLKISKFIEENNMRIDLHPDQFVVLNSVKDDVVTSSIKELKYHYNILKILGIKKKVIILHLGSSTYGKTKSMERFINNFNKLDKNIQNVIVLENDDKIFNIRNILKVCNKINIPFVLDYHHYKCNNSKESIENYIIDIFDTWKGDTPKIHFSSPKSKLKKEFRSHNDYIDSKEFIKFIEKIKFCDRDFDIMIEAKRKDEALFKLVRELKYLTNYKFIDDTTFIVK